ncbi:unnamed protein product [Rangifer tarandus platyrhynchus]|uniref:Uncharacterized protein n=1 Tax=Rangifer tarandus platyrhynchus TaxID=3082113 RepID=A0AC60A7B8_RANTA
METEQRTDKKFRQGFTGALAAAVGMRTSNRLPFWLPPLRSCCVHRACVVSCFFLPAPASPSPHPHLLLLLPCGSAGKESTCNAVDLGSIPGWGGFPWRRDRLSTPVFLPGEFHGQRSLAALRVTKSQTRLSNVHTGFCSRLCRSHSWAFYRLCIFLSRIWPDCACVWLFLVPDSVFGPCSSRRDVSRCPHCSSEAEGSSPSLSPRQGNSLP